MSDDSDADLVRYLLGELPDAEAERLDERSITDDELALRLRVLENDLIDRYARGEPIDATLERFDRVYHASPHLREKVTFAQALSAVTARDEPGGAPAQSQSFPSWPGWRNLAAAAVLVAAVAAGAAGYFGVRHLRMRDEVVQLEERRAEIERKTTDLRQELEQAHAATSPRRSPVTATFPLPPPRRSLGSDTTTISLPRGTEQVTLRVQVESDQYATFWAALRDLATGRIVWRSGDLSAETSGSGSDRIVSVMVPADRLTIGRYSVELSGITSRGAAEVVGRYVVGVVLE